MIFLLPFMINIGFKHATWALKVKFMNVFLAWQFQAIVHLNEKNQLFVILPDLQNPFKPNFWTQFLLSLSCFTVFCLRKAVEYNVLFSLEL